MKYLAFVALIVGLCAFGVVNAKDSTVEGKQVVVESCTGCHGT